jgi:hypothetical protein
MFHHVLNEERSNLALKQTSLLVPVFTEVMPLRIYRVDNVDFLFASPSFDLLFPLDSGNRIAYRFEVYQTVNIVSVGKTGNQVMFVLIDSLFNIAGNTDIQSATSAGHDINIEGFRAGTLWSAKV